MNRWVAWAVGALGVTATMTQLALMRELLGAFAGNELVLGIVLGSWLLLTAAGTWAGRIARRFRHPERAVFLLLPAVAVLPLLQVMAVRLLRDVVFIRGALVGVTETIGATVVVLLPFCVVSGFLLTLASAAMGGAAGLGRVYVADTLGSVVGGAVFSLVLVEFFDHLTLLYFPALLTLIIAALLAYHVLETPVVRGLRRSRTARILVVVLAVLCAVLVFEAITHAERVTIARQYPQQPIIFQQNSPYGRLVVTATAGQRNFIQNGVPLFSTDDPQRIEETVHYAMAQRPDARRVLLVGGGVSGTARELLKYPRVEVTYVELDPLILRAANDAVADPRITVVTGDGRRFVRQAAAEFDVVIVDVPAPTTSQLNRFYTAEFFGEVKRALAPGGVMSFALGRYENYLSPELARLLAVAHATARTHFRNVAVLPGGRVFFVASDAAVFTDLADRLTVPTRVVNGHYLAATLTADRQAELQRAVAAPAPVNRDYVPVLYFEHLRYWLRQYEVRFGLLEVGLAVGLALYLVWLRAVPLAVFAGGFAASALEVVLLLAFQIAYGSVYRQLGVLVTLFMAGLALGAWWANRWRSPSLAVLAVGIAGVAAVLPWLARVGWLIGPVTLAVAVLVGMEFPVAGRTEFTGAAPTAARLFTADLVGACLGALLVSTLVIPLWGVTAACWVAAGLNAVAAAAVWRRRG